MSSQAGSGQEARGIIVSHGSMCHGMVDAVMKITGAPEGTLVAVSNQGRGPEELLRAVGAAAGEGPAVIFTDLPTGSCALAARFVCRDPGNRRVIFGTNLPMLLDFVFKRDMPLDDLVERLLARGRAEIRSLEPPTADGDDDRAQRGAEAVDDPPQPSSSPGREHRTSQGR